MTDTDINLDNYTVTGKALAQWLDLSDMRVSQLASEGVLTREGKGAYPLRKCVRQYCVYSRGVSRGSDTAQAERAARTRLANVSAELKELEHSEKTGELLQAATVHQQDAALAGILSNNLLSIPDRIAPVLAAETDDGKIYDLLFEEINRSLGDVVDAMEATEVDDATLDITRREAAEYLAENEQTDEETGNDE